MGLEHKPNIPNKVRNKSGAWIWAIVIYEEDCARSQLTSILTTTLRANGITRTANWRKNIDFNLFSLKSKSFCCCFPTHNLRGKIPENQYPYKCKQFCLSNTIPDYLVVCANEQDDQCHNLNHCVFARIGRGVCRFWEPAVLSLIGGWQRKLGTDSYLHALQHLALTNFFFEHTGCL